MTTCLIGLGGNLGNVPQTIVQALQLLSQSPGVRVERWSSLYQTAPVGAAAGTEFTNAAAQLETTLSAGELLSSLLAVEDELGRERSIEWGPRTLDLDLLFFGDNVIDDPPVLHVPHSGCWYRRFVLDPLFELVPDFVHPEKQQTIAELRARYWPGRFAWMFWTSQGRSTRPCERCKRCFRNPNYERSGSRTRSAKTITACSSGSIPGRCLLGLCH